MKPAEKFDEIIKKIPINVKRAIFYGIVIGFLSHLFFLTNKFINHDDLLQLVYDMDFSTSGRWFLKYASAISSSFSMPWVNGSLVIFYTAFMSAILVYLFDIKSRLGILLLSSIMITFPSNAALFPYTNSYDAYVFGALLAFIGVYLFTRFNRINIFTIVLTILSLATYQVYFGVCFTILIIYYFKKLLNKEIVAKAYIKNILNVIITYLLSIILYILFTKYILRIELTNYQGINGMENFDIASLIFSIPNAFMRFFSFFTLDDYHQFGFIRYLNIILLISVGYLLIKIIRNLNSNEKILSMFTMLGLPIIINLIFIMAPYSAIGLRMLQGYTIAYLFFIGLTEYFSNKKIGIENIAIWSISLITTISIFNFIIVSNKVYMTYELDRSNILSYTTRVISKIENEDFYARHKNVYFIGNPDVTTDFTKEYTTPEVLISTLLDKKVVAHYYWKYYPERYAAFPNHIENIWNVDYQKIKDKKLKAAIDKMPLYPKKGCVMEYNNEIYIKFKEYK